MINGIKLAVLKNLVTVISPAYHSMEESLFFIIDYEVTWGLMPKLSSYPSTLAYANKIFLG